MTQAPARAPARIHSIDCPCRDCQLPVPSTVDDSLSANAVARLALSGVATGLALAAVHDWMVGGPGLLAAFGW